MKTKPRLSMIAISMLFAGSAFAGNNPVDEPWWPSEFGANDEMGASQYITPQKRIEAAKLVKQGKMALLGMPYSNAMPLVPGRTFALSIPGAPTHGPLPWPGEGFAQTFMDELVTAEIGQVGTQWDGFAHPMIRIQGKPGWKDGNYFYNGVRLEDVETPRGLKKNGTEKAGGFFTRGILIDMAALKGVERLPKGYAITIADYKAALQKQGIGDATKGDVVLLRTGYGRQKREKGPVPMHEGQAGWHAACLPWLRERGVAAIGSDTANDVVPSGYLQVALPVHSIGIVAMGLWLIDNCDLEALTATCERLRRWEFCFSVSPLRIQGGTGSPVNPLASF